MRMRKKTLLIIGAVLITCTIAAGGAYFLSRTVWTVYWLAPYPNQPGSGKVDVTFGD